MKTDRKLLAWGPWVCWVALILLLGSIAAAQDGPPPAGGPGQRGFGPGGPGGPINQERKLVASFDRNADGWLNAEERAEARAASSATERGRPQRMGRGGPGRELAPPQPGLAIQPADVPASTAPLYDPSVVRTLFLEFPNADWEEELEAFNNTDVDVPATLIVDGATYRDVGVHFRGASSFMGVPRGYKRSLNLAVDFIHEDQRLYGYKTLNLLNAHQDPSLLHTVLYLDIARQYIAAPKANFVRVVINGEDWGLYVNAQQFNKDLIAENFPQSKGARWKVPGRPGGRAGLEYLGEDVNAYRQLFEIKTDDKDESWRHLINLCRVLNQTPLQELPAALEPILNVDGVLWFLALENALVNSDGYWVRASDYSLYLDPEGRFHVIPHDVNETFQPGMGPGMGGGPGRGRGPGRDGPGPEGTGGFPPRGGPPAIGGEGGARGERPWDGPPGARGAGGPPLGPPPGPLGEGRPRGFEGGMFPPGPGGPGGPGGMAGMDLDPLVGMEDTTKPLRSRILAVPAWRQRYLEHVKTIAETHLDWQSLQPKVAAYVQLIAPIVEVDVKRMTSLADFYRTTATDAAAAAPGGEIMRGPRSMTLQDFAEARRAFLLNHPAIREGGARAP